TPIALPGVGLPMPTEFRFFSGGAENVFAIDNCVIGEAAEYTTFGTGCPGALGVPVLAAAPGVRAVLGGTMVVDLDNLPVGVGVMISGMSNTLFGGGAPLPLPLGGLGFPGCDLLVDAVIVNTISGPGTMASWSFQIPATPILAGVELF